MRILLFTIPSFIIFESSPIKHKGRHYEKVLFILFLAFNFATARLTVILVAYHSLTENTKIMARAAADGARSVKDVDVKLLKIKNIKMKTS